MAEDVSVTFGASIEKLTAGIAQATSALEGFAAPFAALQASAGALGEALAAAFSVDKIAQFFSQMADLGVQTQRTAALLGISTSAVSGLDVAARASGGTLEGVTKSLERFGLALVKGDAGSKQQAAALSALGLSAKDFIGVPLPDVLGKLADSFSVLKDGIDKDAIAMALMGRGGAQMIPIFNEGSAAFTEFNEIAQRAGTNMSEEVAAGFAKTHLALIEMNDSFSGLGISIDSIFKPAFDGLVKITIDLVEQFTQALNQGGSLRALFDVMAGSVKVLVTALAISVAAIETLWTVTKEVVGMIANDFMLLGKIIAAAMTGNIAGVKAAWQELVTANSGVTKNAATEMQGIFDNLIAEIKTSWGLGADAQVKIEQTKVARMKIANQDLINAQLKAVQEQIKAADAAYKLTVERLNTGVKTYQITESQKVQATLAAITQRENAELIALNSEMAIGNLSATQRQQIENQKTQIVAKASLDRQKIVDEEAIKEAQTWKAGADQVAGVFNGQLKGMLSGQITFAQGMKNISADLALKLIEDINKWALEQIAQYIRVHVFDTAMQALGLSTHVSTEAAKTAATTAGVGARTSAEVAGSSTSLLAQIGNTLAVIAADAGKAFAGVFAFLAPVMGPAAAGPAAASSATVLAAGSGIAALATGTNFVPQTGLALLHKGEAVIPASQNIAPFGAGAGNSGAPPVSVIFHNNGGSITAAQIQQFSRQIAQMVADQWRFNPSIRPAY